MDLSNLRPADGSKQSDNFRCDKTWLRRWSDAFIQKNPEERFHEQEL